MKTRWTLFGGIFGVVMVLLAHTSTWYQNFDQALGEAQKTGKVLLIVFSGSDWCPWCIKLANEVFQKPAFQAYAKKHLVLMLADFPKKKRVPPDIQEQNVQLAKQFDIEGLPTVILLNSKGELIAKTGYRPGGAKAYVEHLKKILKPPSQIVH